MTNFKECNRCLANCRHKGAIRLCECGKFVKVAQTNGDEIRSMNDEELSVFLRKILCRGAALESCDEFWEDDSYGVEWLEQEAL